MEVFLIIISTFLLQAGLCIFCFVKKMRMETN